MYFYDWLFISDVPTANPSIRILVAGYIGWGLSLIADVISGVGVAKNILCLEHFHFNSQRHALVLLRTILARCHVVIRESSVLFLFIMRKYIQFEIWFSIQTNARITTLTDENLYPSVIFQSTLKVHLSVHFVFFVTWESVFPILELKHDFVFVRTYFISNFSFNNKVYYRLSHDVVTFFNCFANYFRLVEF